MRVCRSPVVDLVVMRIGQSGHRPRFYAERKALEARGDNPMIKEVTDQARGRLIREIKYRTRYTDAHGFSQDFELWTVGDINRICGADISDYQLETFAKESELDDFLQILEIAVARIMRHRMNPLVDVAVLQSVLADDFSIFRLVNVRTSENPLFQVQPIDNVHLHAEIVDRTFELTRDPRFASAQTDYAEAWKHYSRGDLDDSVVNAHKAFESTSKVLIKAIEPASNPDQMMTNQLVPELVRLDILPSRLNNMVGHLQQIFTSAGSLRNTAGTGHGALVPTSPEATVALLALRMSGTLVSFLVERLNQMRP